MKLNKQGKTLYKDSASQFIFRYCLSCIKNKMDGFQNFLRKCGKDCEVDVDEMDEIWRQKRKMNEDDIEELISVTVPAAAHLSQVKERNE